MINPDNSEVQNIYNSVGLVEWIREKENNAEYYSNVVDAIHYGPNEQIILKDLANGTQEFYSYDKDQLYRLIQKQTITNYRAPSF